MTAITIAKMEKVQATLTTASTPSSMSQASSGRPNTRDLNHRVRVLKKSEYKQAAACLADAFKDDEVAGYFVHTGDREGWTDKQYWDLHVHILECLTRAHLMKGLVTAIGPDYDCVALWMPPGKEFDDFCSMLWSGLLKLKWWGFSKEGRIRFYNEFLPLLHNKKHEVLGADDPHAWYLVYIGCKTASRGRGYAKTLIEYTTKEADLQNRICYLESSNVLNEKLYNRLGFQRVGHQAVLRRGPKPVIMDIMVRKPIVKQLASKTSSFVDGAAQ